MEALQRCAAAAPTVGCVRVHMVVQLVLAALLPLLPLLTSPVNKEASGERDRTDAKN